MKMLVGLGNPGKEYENTRHNLGFMVIDQLANELNVELNKKKFNGFYCQTSECILLKPQTYMNNSGECILTFMNYFQIPFDNLLIIYDEIALVLGKFRYRQQGSAGGHNGVKNIIEKLGNKNFGRLRVGIDYDRNFTLHDWVLGKFTAEEKEKITTTFSALLDSLEEWIKGSNLEKIMNKFN